MQLQTIRALQGATPHRMGDPPLIGAVIRHGNVDKAPTAHLNLSKSAYSNVA
jgi:hypothetical protein